MHLVVFKVDTLGDNVVFLPIIQSLKRLHPDCKITLFTTPLAAPLYRGKFAPDQLVEIDRDAFNAAWRKPWKFIELLRQLPGIRPHAALIGNNQGGTAYFLPAWSRIPIRVGLDQAPRAVKRSLIHSTPLQRKFLTHSALVGPEAPAAMINWEVAHQLLEVLGAPGWPAHPPVPYLAHLQNEAKPTGNAITIHPGGSLPFKRWFPGHYVELANRLAGDFPVTWVAQDFPEEKGLAASVQKVRTSSLPDLVQLLGGSRLFVGNNSGPMNLAVALGTPSVILNGPSALRWSPFWNSERILMLRDSSLPCIGCDLEVGVVSCQNFSAPMACMKAWTVETVEQNCRKWIQRFEKEG